MPFLAKLGVNVIRTYNIDPEKDHKECMKLLDDAGIYVISDLAHPGESIDRSNPTWNLGLLNRYTSVVDVLSQYSNVIGFFAGNEVTNNASYTPASAFVKAAVRDTKSYIKSKGLDLGVGYAADDDAGVRVEVASYFNCGDPTEGIDFWGYNIYSWCDPSDYEKSGYQNHTRDFASYNVPVFFAEYGCNVGKVKGGANRPFTEIAALYGDDMSQVFSGGIVYEYFQETNDYGLVDIKGSTVTPNKAFNAFSSQIRAISPSSVNSAKYSPTNTAMQSCPTVAKNWQVAPTGLPPTPDKAVCDCMVASLTCKAKSGMSGEEIGALFGDVCGRSESACSQISFDTSKGKYGAFMGCAPEDQLSHAFNAFYLENKSAAFACDFNGNATVVKASGSDSTCSSRIAAATSAAASGGNGGSVDSSPTGDKSAATSMRHASLNLGSYAWAAYFGTVMLSGLGIFLL